MLGRQTQNEVRGLSYMREVLRDEKSGNITIDSEDIGWGMP